MDFHQKRCRSRPRVLPAPGRMSGFTFLEPVKQGKVKRDKKNRSQRAAREISLLVVLIYSMFLWSVPTSQFRHSSRASFRHGVSGHWWHAATGPPNTIIRGFHNKLPGWVLHLNNGGEVNTPLWDFVTSNGMLTFFNNKGIKLLYCILSKGRQGFSTVGARPSAQLTVKRKPNFTVGADSDINSIPQLMSVNTSSCYGCYVKTCCVHPFF